MPLFFSYHLSAGVVKRRRLQVVHRIHRRIPRHQHSHDVEMALLASPMQGRVVVPVTLVHVSIVVDVLKQGVQIALKCCVGGFRRGFGGFHFRRGFRWFWIYNTGFRWGVFLQGVSMFSHGRQIIYRSLSLDDSRCSNEDISVLNPA